MHKKTKTEAATVAAPLVQARPRGRPRSTEATAAVLEAAYRLSAERGLKGATIQAVALSTGVSRVTIYKWWENRLHLLIDAFLQHATLVLPIADGTTPAETIHAHAARYAEALQGDLGRVMLAVLAECMNETGSSALFTERYLSIRRKLGVSVIRRGQKDGSIASQRKAELLYDQIYGTILYRYQFGLKGFDKTFVRTLVDATFNASGPES
jgi:AcrR family transcriptional regulator